MAELAGEPVGETSPRAWQFIFHTRGSNSLSSRRLRVSELVGVSQYFTNAFDVMHLFLYKSTASSTSM
ncbi:hypothetical protein T09_2561 [Trichinella sp. T9]|nr:hypothetical protein T09_2561 [Trichinella sp. T9]